MDEFINNILRGLITYSIGIFFLLGLGLVIYLWKFVLGLHEWQTAVFGLERHVAKRKLASASTGLILLILLFIGEFMLITVIGPQLPTYSTVATPTIDPFITPTTTLSPEEARAADMMPAPTIGQVSLISECPEGVLEITSPGDGDEVSGTVEIIGTVNIEDFGSYKYEYSTIGVVNWITIAAGNQLKLDENLGYWYTSSLQPGIYLLQLVPLNNIGDELTPCIITVEVITEE